MFSVARKSNPVPTGPIIFRALIRMVVWRSVWNCSFTIMVPVPPFIADCIVNCEHYWRNAEDDEVGTDDVFSFFEHVSVDAKLDKDCDALDDPNSGSHISNDDWDQSCLVVIADQQWRFNCEPQGDHHLGHYVESVEEQKNVRATPPS